MSTSNEQQRQHQHPQRIAWVDRFKTPSVEQLRNDLPKQAAQFFDAMREGLRTFEGVSESFAWQGENWNWTLQYHINDREEPIAVLVPSPTDLQLAMPLDRQFIDTLPWTRLKRSVREGLELAREPYETRWAVWTLQFPNLIDDLLNIVSRRLDHLGKQSAS